MCLSNDVVRTKQILILTAPSKVKSFVMIRFYLGIYFATVTQKKVWMRICIQASFFILFQIRRDSGHVDFISHFGCGVRPFEPGQKAVMPATAPRRPPPPPRQQEGE